MAFITLSTLVTDPFVAALCNTLVHSLWQGLVLAALTGFIIMLTRKASAATRYNLLIAALALFAIGVSLTFIAEFKKATVATAVTSRIQQIPIVDTFGPASTEIIYNNTPVQAASFSDRLFGYLNQNHNTIVLIWFLIICAKSIQLAFGLWGVHRLKTRQVSAVSAFWNDKIYQLANSLTIKQTISLLESGLTKVPMVIGNLKPVILIPIGLLTALTTEEVEAILVHELAHIKRRDYLVNLLQSLMEIVFFFNPAVLWISQLIKAERENCCDDLALTQSSNKVSYIRALVSCEEYQQSIPAYAMAFPGGKSSLFDRVRRIAGNRNHSLNLFEKTVLAICLVVSGLCMSAYAEKENIKRAAHAVVRAIQHVKETVAPTQPAIPAKEDLAIKPSASPILTAQMPSLHDAVTIQRNDTDTAVNLNLKLGSLKPIAGRLASLSTGYYSRISDTSKISYGPGVAEFYLLSAMRKDGLVRTGSSTRLTEKELIIDGIKQPADVHQKYWAIRQYFEAKRVKDSIANIERKRQQNILFDEMIKDGLITSRTGLSYKISEKEFIVNGVKQREEVRKKYFANSIPTEYNYPFGNININPKVYAKIKSGIDTVPKKVEFNNNKKVDVKTNLNTDVKVDTKADVKTNVNADVKTNTNVDYSSRLDTLRYSPSITFLSKDGKRSTYKGNMNMLYKPGRVTYSARAPYKQDSSAKLNFTNKLSLKLYLPKMGDLLYDEGVIKDKANFSGYLSNDVLIVNGATQPENIHQKILKKYQKKPDDKVNLSFTYGNAPGRIVPVK